MALPGPAIINNNEELDELWTSILSIDHEFGFSKGDKVSAKDLPLELTNFISHYCKQRHYFFDILNCGKDDCEICLPPRLPADVYVYLRSSIIYQIQFPIQKDTKNNSPRFLEPRPAKNIEFHRGTSPRYRNPYHFI